MRPRTLPLAAAAVLPGSALAYNLGAFKWPVAVFSLLTAALLQILSNLANDYGDGMKGTDNAERVGPRRILQSGLVTPKEMRAALAAVSFLCALSGLALLLTAGLSLYEFLHYALLGLFAIAAAITYTVGWRPYGYLGLGDAFVLVFFGWVGVGLTYDLHAGHLRPLSVMLAATACGLLIVGVLNINNLRDLEGDRAAGKKTLAVRLGLRRGKTYHYLLLAGALALLTVYALLSRLGPFGWLFLLGVPLLYRHGRAVGNAQNPEALRPLLTDMVRAAFVCNLLFSLGLILDRLL